MAKLFFSYSHKDEDLRDELEVHLSSLKRQGTLEIWHDRRIGAGNDFSDSIDANLKTADIILLLVSPYFIASDYCIDKEMVHAINKPERNEARVIPVILHPCDWQDLPFGKLLAVPNDGKPISKFPNKHDGFLEITLAIKDVAKSLNTTKEPTASPNAQKTRTGNFNTAVNVRSSNLRVRKDFTDRDKENFMTEAFEYMAKYFDGSLTELEKRNAEIETNYRRIDANKFTSVIYKNGAEVSRATIKLNANLGYRSGITYSTSDQDNSYNESMSVEDDGHMMTLKALGMSFHNRMEKEELTLEGAAEYYWHMLISSLQ